MAGAAISALPQQRRLHRRARGSVATRACFEFGGDGTQVASGSPAHLRERQLLRDRPPRGLAVLPHDTEHREAKRALDLDRRDVRAALGTNPHVHVGIGGWNYEPWRGGHFYPPGLPTSRELAYAAQRLGIQPATLKSLRSQAGQAQARIDAGEAQPGDRALARCAPPHVLCGAEKRYRVRDLDRWMAKHRPDRGADPLCERPPEPWGRLLTPEQLAARMGIAPSCLAGYRLRCRRALRWLALHPEAPPEQRASIREGMRQAFNPPSPDWQAQVWAQGLEAARQAVQGLSAEA